MSVRAMAHFSLPDDTEQDLVGADWHQNAIVRLYDSLVDLADQHGYRWHVGNQLTLVAHMPDGAVWRPSPDIMIHPDAGSDQRKEMVVATDGSPALVVEVASESTWRYDVNDRDGKAAGYLSIGVREYLVFDPLGDYLSGQCRGWRRVGDSIEPWSPSAEGGYQSQALGISLRPEGRLLRVLDGQGRPVLFGVEKRREIASLEAENARLRGQAGVRRPRGSRGSNSEA